ncbi:MAG: HAMP domain-containing protein [Chloroflexi bacterium]|nr:HAMP domain-containing protein [Chloroflexota bacterium]
MSFIDDVVQRLRGAEIEEQLEEAPAQTQEEERLWRLPTFARLQTKLIVPYVVLTMIIAMVGTYIITRLVTSSVRERFINQLAEASRVAADGIVQRESVHLANLRLMVFTNGVAEAILNQDAPAVQDLLWPLVLNNNIEALTVVDSDGEEILTLAQDPNSGQYVSSRGGNFSQYALVARALGGQTDEVGDKFIELLQTTHGPYLFTSAPVRDSGGQIVGAVLVGTRLETLLAELKALSLADVVVLDSSGKVVAATLADPPGGFSPVELAPEQAAKLTPDQPSQLREVNVFNRDFQAVYAPLIIRRQPIGVLEILLPSNYVVSTEATSRNWLSVLFALGTVGVIVVGYLLAQTIVRPIMRLRAVSQAVAAGDLQQNVGLQQSDEIGELATAFDVMTLKLRERTAEAARLYAETVHRNKALAQANAKLQAAQQQLVQSEKLAAIGQLTAGIVHDVKNPLAVVIGMADELRDDPKLDKETRQHLSTIRDNAWRASTIISDLLKFARQSTPEMKLQDIGATITTALRLTDYLARKGGVTVVKDIPPQPVLMNYDATQIEQVLINLIQNAIQAMPKGGHLRVNLSPAKDAAAIAVQDTGVGIPQKNLIRIFDPFFTTKPAGEGTGLGLSVSYGIISRHGGRIDVASTPGKGTTFTILLPLNTPAQAH